MLKIITDAVKKIISNKGRITSKDLADRFPILFSDILITGPDFAFSDPEKCMHFICKYLNERRIILPDYDATSHPSHCAKGRKYKPRKVIADWRLSFNLGNAVKYISRAGRKGDKIEDLRKAIQYIEFEIEELEDAKYE